MPLRQEHLFLSKFHNEISKPANSKNPEVDYIPSQIFTEYIRYLCKNRNGGNYDGIIFKSAQTEKENIVLFYDDKNSSSVLSLAPNGIEKLTHPY